MEKQILNDSEKSAGSDIYLRALNLLSRRDHTTAELQRKLAGRGFSAESIAALLELLAGKGYLDDKRFAERWTEAAIRNGRGYGLRIRQELQKRGIPREIAAEAVAVAAAEYPEHESLATIVSRRFSAFDPASAPLKEKQRVYSYLQRRGFSIQAITGFFNTKEEELDR
jgi:regulatory protein